MRSAILVEPRQFRIESKELPEPGDGEVRIRVRGCGVCGSDMGPWKGLPGMSYPLNPGAPGHEVFGTIEAVGPGVQGLSAGQAVTALTYRAYSEYDLAQAGSVIPLPEALAGRPVLGEPVACAVNVMRRSGVQEGDTVVLLGTVFLGTLLLQLLQRHCPSRVFAISRRRMDSGLAERLGVNEVLTYEDDVCGRVGSATGGRPRLSGGGALMDLGVHLIDLSLWLLGDPDVRCVHGGVWKGGEPLRASEVDDFASARIELDGGASISVAVSWNAHAGQDCVIRLAAYGTGGGAELRNVDGSFYDFELARFSGRSGEVVARESRDWLGKAILDWTERLGQGQRFDPDVERSVRVSEVVDAVYRED